MQTNEAINDRAIPSSGEVSIIAAFGPINARKEANAHSMTDRTSEDYKIDFSSLDDHDCSISLYDLEDDDGLKPWPPARLIGKIFFIVFIRIFFFFVIVSRDPLLSFQLG